MKKNRKIILITACCVSAIGLGALCGSIYVKQPLNNTGEEPRIIYSSIDTSYKMKSGLDALLNNMIKDDGEILPQEEEQLRISHQQKEEPVQTVEETTEIVTEQTMEQKEKPYIDEINEQATLLLEENFEGNTDHFRSSNWGMQYGSFQTWNGVLRRGIGYGAWHKYGVPYYITVNPDCYPQEMRRYTMEISIMADVSDTSFGLDGGFVIGADDSEHGYQPPKFGALFGMSTYTLT